MMKKKYQTPAMEVIPLSASRLLAGSTTEQTPAEFLQELQEPDPLQVITDPMSIL